jgi:hypothetical protein
MFARLIPLWAWGIIAAALLATTFGAGFKVASWRCAARQVEALREAQKRFDEQLAKQNEEAREYEAERENARRSGVDREGAIRTVYRTIEVPAECAAPDAVRGVLDDAIREANARAAGEPLPTVPASAEPSGGADRS